MIDPEESDAETTVVRIGGEATWIAHYLASLECRFEVLDSDDVRRELFALGQRFVHDHAEVARRSGRWRSPRRAGSHRRT